MSAPDRLSEFLGPVEHSLPPLNSASNNSNISSSSSSSSLPASSTTIREDQIDNAIAFLQHASVANSPLEQRLAFLRRKGLTQPEIDVALQRARPSALVVQPQIQTQMQQQQQMQMYPGSSNAPARRSRSSLSSWLWFAIAAAGVGGVLALAFRAVWNQLFRGDSGAPGSRSRHKGSRRKLAPNDIAGSNSDDESNVDDVDDDNNVAASDDGDLRDDVNDNEVDDDDDVSDKGPTAKQRRKRGSSNSNTPRRAGTSTQKDRKSLTSSAVVKPPTESLREQLARHEKSISDLSASIKKPDTTVQRNLSQSATRDDIADLRNQITSLASSISRSQVTTPVPSPYSTPWTSGPPAWQQQQLQQSSPLPQAGMMASGRQSLTESAPPLSSGRQSLTESAPPTASSVVDVPATPVDAVSPPSNNGDGAVSAPEFDTIVTSIQNGNGANGNGNGSTQHHQQPATRKKPWESK